MKSDPDGKNERPSNTRDPYEHWRTVVMVGALAISVLALVASIFSAKAANKSASAARQSAAAATAATRAWIASRGGRFTEIKDSRVRFEFGMQNVGSTPGINVVVNWEIVFVPGPDMSLIKQPEFATCPSKNETRLGVVDAKRTWVMEVPSDPLDETKFKMLADKTAHLYIYGCVRYRDVLVPEMERLTEVGLIYPSLIGEPTLTMYDKYCRMR